MSPTEVNHSLETTKGCGGTSTLSRGNLKNHEQYRSEGEALPVPAPRGPYCNGSKDDAGTPRETAGKSFLEASRKRLKACAERPKEAK